MLKSLVLAETQIREQPGKKRLRAAEDVSPVVVRPVEAQPPQFVDGHWAISDIIKTMKQGGHDCLRAGADRLPQKDPQHTLQSTD